MKRVALIGAGRGGSALLPILCDYKDIEVVGVADVDASAPGLEYAKSKNIPVFCGYHELLAEKEPDVVLNLTHDSRISDDITAKKSNIEVLGRLGAKLLWDLVYERRKKEGEKIKLLDELAETNRELHETSNYLKNILEYSGDMIITTDLNATIVSCNKVVEDLLGYRRNEIVGTHVEEFYFDKSDRRNFMTSLESGESMAVYETKLKKKDGEVIDVSLTLSLLRDNHENVIGTVGISKDITEKKRLEEEILRSNKELASFVYTVSHDLQAPLRAMNGFSELLMEEFKDKLTKEGIHYIERIKIGSERMKVLIEDLLEVTKIGRTTNPYENISVKELVEDIKESFHYELEKKNAIIHLLDLPVIYCDKARMHQVFVNLITNALKYVKNGVDPEIEIACSLRENFFEFSIKDNGIGINQQYFIKIFELFHRLHNVEEYAGTGVGLTIVNRIVEMHGGKVWLESEEGVGTTFYFTHPLKKIEKI